MKATHFLEVYKHRSGAIVTFLFPARIENLSNALKETVESKGQTIAIFKIKLK